MSTTQAGPSKEDLADARVFVQAPSERVRVEGKWFVLANSDVWFQHESGSFDRSMFDAASVTAPSAGWVEVSP